MSRIILTIVTVTFFLLVNTTYFWEGKMEEFGMFTFLGLVVYFFVLFFLLIYQVQLSIKEKHTKRKRTLLILLMMTVLNTTLLYPRGLITFEKFESPSILIAQREGAANCTTTLKLKENKQFVETSVCFGISEITGTYRVVNDTIYFENVSLGRTNEEFYEFAVIKSIPKNDRYVGEIVRFKNRTDTTGITLWVIKNELKK